MHTLQDGRGMGRNSFGKIPTGDFLSKICESPKQIGVLASPGTLPSRQGSEVALLRTKTHSQSQNIFNEVLDQLTSQDESLPRQTSLYTLPSMNFLESLLDEMDSRNASMGIAPMEPPMILPMDSLDLPGLDFPVTGKESLEELGLGPSPVSNKVAYSCPTLQQGPSSDSLDVTDVLTESAMMKRSPFISGFAPTAGSAAPSPQKGQRNARAPVMDDLDEENLDYEFETSLQTSKSGRCRKVSNFASGRKRKSHAISQYSAPAELLHGPPPEVHYHTTSINREPEVASAPARKPQKSACTCVFHCLIFKRVFLTCLNLVVGRKGKPVVCLNCGSCETPQWRCGPLGPRTLCNACGVRYKKGLPLSCWPLRNGMVLPPGAELPPNVVVPQGMTIVTQPAKC